MEILYGRDFDANGEVKFSSIRKTSFVWINIQKKVKIISLARLYNIIYYHNDIIIILFNNL